jgi:hypothetical protein
MHPEEHEGISSAVTVVGLPGILALRDKQAENSVFCCFTKLLNVFGLFGEP